MQLDFSRSVSAKWVGASSLAPRGERELRAFAEGLLNEYRANGRKSLDRAKGCIKRLGEFFGMSRALDITTERMDAYVERRLEEDGAAAATIARELAILRRMFRLAQKRGRLSYLPEVPTLSLDNARKGFSTGRPWSESLASFPSLSALSCDSRHSRAGGGPRSFRARGRT